MTSPGFTAEAALRVKSQDYRTSNSQILTRRTTGMIPQRFRGSLCDDMYQSCVDDCYIVDLQCLDACDDAWAQCVVGPGFP